MGHIHSTFVTSASFSSNNCSCVENLKQRPCVISGAENTGNLLGIGLAKYKTLLYYFHSERLRTNFRGIGAFQRATATEVRVQRFSVLTRLVTASPSVLRAREQTTRKQMYFMAPQ